MRPKAAQKTFAKPAGLLGSFGLGAQWGVLRSFGHLGSKLKNISVPDSAQKAFDPLEPSFGQGSGV